MLAFGIYEIDPWSKLLQLRMFDWFDFNLLLLQILPGLNLKIQVVDEIPLFWSIVIAILTRLIAVQRC